MDTNQNNNQQPTEKKVEQPRRNPKPNAGQISLPPISLNLLTLICDGITMFFIFLIKLLRMTDASVTVRRVFSWLAGITLMIGIVCYVLKQISERKFTITPTVILQMFITFVYLVM